MKTHWSFLIALLVVVSDWALADSVDARCDIYPAGEDKPSTMLPCRFSQRQGFVTISRSDGVLYELSPVGDTPGNFKDGNGGAVYRQSGLGDQGLIFRFVNESVYVYWDTGAQSPKDSNSPTYPFTTADYDATTLLRCRAASDAEFGSCPAGILRMEERQASIVVQSPDGEQFTINFLSDVVNATNRKVKAVLDGDLWTVTVDDRDIYEVPLAAIEGG